MIVSQLSFLEISFQRILPVVFFILNYLQEESIFSVTVKDLAHTPKFFLLMESLLILVIGSKQWLMVLAWI